MQGESVLHVHLSWHQSMRAGPAQPALFASQSRCSRVGVPLQYGNPHSRTHMYGWESEDAVEKARQQVRQPAAAGTGAASTACSP
jgi:cysteine sulfinate desulfinase/cysteine desulfurase-like protein